MERFNINKNDDLDNACLNYTSDCPMWYIGYFLMICIGKFVRLVTFYKQFKMFLEQNKSGKI
jgi:hypothetical protein